FERFKGCHLSPLTPTRDFPDQAEPVQTLEPSDLLFQLIDRLLERTNRPFLGAAVFFWFLHEGRPTVFQELQLGPCQLQSASIFNANRIPSTIPFAVPCRSSQTSGNRRPGKMLPDVSG